MQKSILRQKAIGFHKSLVELGLPQGKRQRIYYNLCVKGCKILVNEGPERLYYNFKNYIQKQSNPERFFNSWIRFNEPDSDKLTTMKNDSKEFGYRPKISIIIPVWNTDERWLKAVIESVIAQVYDNWELCIADGGSINPNLRILLDNYSHKYEKIKIKYLDKNLGVSANSNGALSLATGEFIGLMDPNDELAPFALYEVVNLLNSNKILDMIYSDEDKIDDEGRRYDPFFKPDWSPDLLNSFMYIGHFTVYRKSLINDLGGFRSEYDFSQDYDLALRATEHTSNIAHIQKILYHWRSIPVSVASAGNEFARGSNIKALASAVERRSYKGKAIMLQDPYRINRIKLDIMDFPLVSIIIPTDNECVVSQCINSILNNTSYKNLDIIIVTNSYLSKILKDNFGSKIRTVIFDRQFNFSLKCNKGAEASLGEYLLFLNDDMEIVSKSWVEEMLELFQRPEVGAVGAKLIYDDDSIQHAGLVTGVRGFIGTAFHCQPKDSHYYFDFIQSTRNVSALSAACMMISKKLFNMLCGFDYINAPIAHSDVDISFRIREKGYLLVYTPFAVLKHFGHASLCIVESNYKKDNADLYLLKRWAKFISNDPYYTKNMRDFLYVDSNIPFNLIVGSKGLDDNNTSPERNILFITHDLSLSGAPISIFNIAKYIKNQGNFVTVMSPSEGPLIVDYMEQNIPLIIEGSLYQNIHTLTQKIISNFDIIICNTIISWPLVHICKSMGLTVVWFIHESNAGLEMADSDYNIAEAFKLADIVAFPSQYTAKLYEKFKVDNNFRVLYQGVEDLQLAKTDNSFNKLTILNIGSIESRKGQDLLVRSILNLPEKYLDLIDVFLVGRILNKNYNLKLKKLIKNHGNIHLMGQVNKKKLNELLAVTDIYVCTSRDEAFPITILEAMSRSKAIISFDVGGISEMFDNGVNGIVIPFGDTKKITEYIMKLFDDREYRLSLGLNAYKKFKDNYTIENYGNRFLSILDEIY